MNPDSAICHLPSDIATSRDATDALRFFSWLQAELDVQAFQIHRDRLNAKRARLDRESAANKAAARLMTGVINIEAVPVPAPTGRLIPAHGNAMGSTPTNQSSPEGAIHNPTP